MSGMGQEAKFEIGDVKIHIGRPDSANPPEFWTDLAVDKIMAVANTAPQPIRDQAFAFQDRIRNIILHTIRVAVQERQVRDALLAQRHRGDAEQAIREDK